MTRWSGLLAVALMMLCGTVAGAQGSANPGTGMLPLESGWVFYAGDDAGGLRRAGELFGFGRVAALLGRRWPLAEVMAEAQGF